MCNFQDLKFSANCGHNSGEKIISVAVSENLSVSWNLS